MADGFFAPSSVRFPEHKRTTRDPERDAEQAVLVLLTNPEYPTRHMAHIAWLRRGTGWRWSTILRRLRREFC